MPPTDRLRVQIGDAAGSPITGQKAERHQKPLPAKLELHPTYRHCLRQPARCTRQTR